MVSVVSVTGPSSVGAVALTVVVLAIVIAGVALEVAGAAGGGTVSERGLVLGGRNSLGRPLFRLVCWEGSVSSTTRIAPSEDSPSSGLCSLCSVKCAVLLVSASSSSANGSVSHFGFLR